MITVYTPEEVEKISAAGRLTADTLSMLEKAVKPGMSTYELDELAEKFIRDRGGSQPAKAMKASLPPSVPLLTILLSTESLREEKFLKKVISFLLILWYN